MGVGNVPDETEGAASKPRRYHVNPVSGTHQAPSV